MRSSFLHPQRHGIGFLALLSLLLAICNAACADETSQVVEGFHATSRNTPYELQGNSISALLAEKNTKGPLDEGKRLFAHTHWDLKWNYLYEERGDGFAITLLSVNVDLQFTMPHRELRPGVADQVAPQWTRFMKALTTHENGHAENANQHGKALYELLRKPRVFASEQALKDFIASEGGKCIAKARAADVEYDRKTQHGATQGATLR